MSLVSILTLRKSPIETSCFLMLQQIIARYVATRQIGGEFED